ncbi:MULTISPECIES: hypothetical protein [Brevibacillus]|uniref:hypothetical protein n=1 Tax=Brevibacillus TaxID=55080 RepID=UPI002453C1D9|nr:MULTISPECIES: hypothetical protein [Brevibacillus]MDH4618083.1 hypothetical protein [Brevibacillus sp. AY1]MED1951837.1 hypothetical protein [Brevibacillus centrosporus]
MLNNIQNVDVYGRLTIILNPLNQQMQNELDTMHLNMPSVISIKDTSDNMHQLTVHDYDLDYSKPDAVKFEIKVSIKIESGEYCPLEAANILLNEAYMDLGTTLTLESLGGNEYSSLIQSFEIEWEVDSTQLI